MNSKIKLYLAQLNLIVGDIEGNYQKILAEFEKSERQEADLIIFPEMAITGYAAEDLWQKPYFLQLASQAILNLSLLTKNSKTAILVGAPYFLKEDNKKAVIYNSAFLLWDGKIEKIINKKSLPNQTVFDEKRYFEHSTLLSIVEFKNFSLAILICEDMWHKENSYLLEERSLDAIIVINASPYSKDKALRRLEVASNFIKNINRPLIYLNQIGGQDSLLFDGGSFVLDENAQVILQMGEFVIDNASLTLLKSAENISIISNQPSAILSAVTSRNYSAITLALQDYVIKNNFKQVLIGMSGGIDSALVATIAVDALGAKNVHLYALPSRYNAPQSRIDAEDCANNLGVKLKVISIQPTFQTLLGSLQEEFFGLPLDITEENLQSRIRGNILMAISNKFAWLLLTTGNKSELACGYATLYGDMCGGFNVLKDVYKTEVFELANWRNQNIPFFSKYQHKNLIPLNIINKAPSAELRFEQKDSDSLPEYKILDKILYLLIEEQKSVKEIVNQGFEEELVKKVAKLFYSSEYKRKQAVLGVKISNMSFDKERRYPITNKFYE
jgi:NAD+ synthase